LTETILTKVAMKKILHARDNITNEAVGEGSVVMVEVVKLVKDMVFTIDNLT